MHATIYILAAMSSQSICFEIKIAILWEGEVKIKLQFLTFVLVELTVVSLTIIFY